MSVKSPESLRIVPGSAGGFSSSRRAPEARGPGGGKAAEWGKLGEGVIPTLLRDIYVGRRTGLLRFEHGDEQRSIRFVDGNIVHGVASGLDTHLGETMVRHGLLRQADLDRALPIVRRTHQRLGSVLQAMGVLDKNGLENGIAIHVHEVLLECFSWTSGRYTFDAQDTLPPEQDDVTLKLSTGELILEAVAQVRSQRAVRFALGDLRRVVIHSTDPLLRYQHLQLSPADGFLLSRVDGHLTAEEILAIVPLERAEAERSLFGLLSTGLVELIESIDGRESPHSLRAAVEDAYRGLTTRDHFAVLGVGRDATEAEIRAAYHERVRRFHPDAHHDPRLSDLRNQMNAVVARIRVAYTTLSAQQTRASYEHLLGESTPPIACSTEDSPPPVCDTRQVEQRLREAGDAVSRGDTWTAIVALQDLLLVARGGQLRKVQILLATVYLRNPEWAREAERLLLGVIEREPQNVEALGLLGEFYRSQGLERRAQSLLDRAAALTAVTGGRGRVQTLTRGGGGQRSGWR